MTIKPEIESEKCTLCGKCAEICPRDVLNIKNGLMEVAEEGCMLCSHCYAVCEFDAVSYNGLLREITMESFPYKEKQIQPGEFSPELMLNLLRSRRSARKFLKKRVPGNMLRDLVEAAVTAPSGSNCQSWEFTILGSREKVQDLAGIIGNYFRKINRIAASPLLRYLSFFVAGRSIIKYYRDHYESVQYGLAEAEKGKDLLFHGAPALIVIHSNMEGSLPVEDAQYASYNIALLAHSMGLGTCYIGYASEVMNRDKKMKVRMNIPEAHRVHAVLALGYPDLVFHRQSLRKEYQCTLI
jgi:nitroreductase/NAD-dependent dihydropyrimidine dehydrogenase PreA subunit